MAKVFQEWTVLPHDPIHKLSDNLWRVSGTMNDGKIQRQMVCARMRDGRVVVHNAIALGDDEMKELEAWGPPSVLVVPNSFHRQDAAIWKQRYPDLEVVTARGSQKRVAKVLAVDAVTEDAPGDDDVRQLPLDGVRAESAMQIRSGDDVTLVFCDTILNVPKRGGLVGFALAPTGQVSAPRLSRWMVIKDKKAFAAQLEQLANLPRLTRVLFGHGAPVLDHPAAALRKVAAQLTG
jgi:hypothetical protein